MSNKLTVPASTPRNHIVVHALMRKAGSHRKSNKALRQQSKKEDRMRAHF